VSERLGREVKRAMAKAGLTSPELARRAGVGQSWIRQVRSGRIDRPAPDKLRAIALELGVDPNVFLGMTDQLGAVMATVGGHGATQPPTPDLAAYLKRINDLVATVERLLTAHEADRAIIASLIGVDEATIAERLAHLHELSEANPPRPAPARPGR
jgi:transcriptional regulator with XRE-family HTH domain